MQNTKIKKQNNILIATETQEQMVIMAWANRHEICKDYLIHIPNQGKHTKRFGHELNKMGRKRGVSDLFLAYPKDQYAGLWIELKSRRKNATVTAEQHVWLKSMEKVGYECAICYGASQAIGAINYYLNRENYEF